MTKQERIQAIEYKVEIGLRNTKIIDGKEVFVNVWGKPIGEENDTRRTNTGD